MRLTGPLWIVYPPGRAPATDLYPALILTDIPVRWLRAMPPDLWQPR
jgi:hypothetical protein